mgnify:CR=1 FL=1
MLQPYTRQQLDSLCVQRAGESRLGQHICLPQPGANLTQQLAQAKNAGCRYALLGIAEDIGPRANFGLPGADKGWSAFLTRFLNLQANSFINAAEILLLGEISCHDLQTQAKDLHSQDPGQLNTLRDLVSVLDQRVTEVVQAIFTAGLMPIVIGGGHNNSYPLLKALTLSSGQSANSANLDPHADFRPLEGRHSGNGFSYAKAQGHLQHYLVMGLHELKNSASSLAQIKNAGVDILSYQQLFVRGQAPWPELLKLWLSQRNPQQVFGIELDTDAITGMPVSAYNSCGVSVQQAEHFVYVLASQTQSRYLHLAEAAPAQHPAGLAAGNNEAGQVLAALVFAFMQGKQHQAPLF